MNEENENEENDPISEAVSSFNQKEFDQKGTIKIEDLADIEAAVKEASKIAEEEKERVIEESVAYEKRVQKMSDEDIDSILKTIEREWQKSETDETLANYITKHPQAFAFVAAIDKRHAGLQNVDNKPLYMSEAVNRTKPKLFGGNRITGDKISLTSHYREG